MLLPEGRGERFIHIYTDAPARYRCLPDGHLDFDRPCNVIVQRVIPTLLLPEAECRLAIRCVFGGRRLFETLDGRFAVGDGAYLVLNQGQHVCSSLQSKTPVECFNITFQPGFAEEVLRSLVMPSDHLLDSPFREHAQPVTFFEKLYNHDQLVTPIIQRLRNTLGKEKTSVGWLEEQLHNLLEAMLQAHRNVAAEVEKMPAVRASTRVEIYARLHRARDYIEASFTRSITLPEMASAACLSPHHFLRLFTQVFGETPHQYVTRRRLEYAQSLLLRTELPVTDICLAVGFESLGSFSWLFRQRFGVAPSRFRERDGTLASG
jgi:AraC-like DNA-binding protein